MKVKETQKSEGKSILECEGKQPNRPLKKTQPSLLPQLNFSASFPSSCPSLSLRSPTSSLPLLHSSPSSQNTSKAVPIATPRPPAITPSFPPLADHRPLSCRPYLRRASPRACSSSTTLLRITAPPSPLSLPRHHHLPPPPSPFIALPDQHPARPQPTPPSVPSSSTSSDPISQPQPSSAHPCHHPLDQSLTATILLISLPANRQPLLLTITPPPPSTAPPQPRQPLSPPSTASKPRHHHVISSCSTSPHCRTSPLSLVFPSNPHSLSPQPPLS